MIEFSFQGVTAAEAGVLARQFQSALVQEGVSAEDVSITRADSEAMYAGATVQLLRDLVTVAEMVAPVIAVPHCAALLWEICKPARAGLVVRCPNGKVFEIKAEEIQPDRLEAILAECGNEANESGSHAG